MSQISKTSVLDPSVAHRLPNDQEASGRSFGEEELRALEAVMRSGTLTSTKGSFVKQLETSIAATLGSRFAHACSSGTSAVHAAIAAIDPEPGDEVVVSPITDMGALTPILYQSAIPVFADVDPVTGNVTADSISRCLSERTRAIVVTHLFGNPCEMGEILSVATRHGVPVIEDCAQAFLASHNHHFVGTMGAIGCFSMQQGKHMTCGEGGFVTTDNDEYARRMFLFINKAWGYGDSNPDHYFLALNSRLSELQGAVALAQLQKLAPGVEHRIRLADELFSQLEGTPGLKLPQVEGGNRHSYWRYCMHVDSDVIPGGPFSLAERLAKRGIAAAPGYIRKPAFETAVFRDQRTFGESRFPFSLARAEAVDYSPERFPGTYAALSGMLVLPWNERMSCEDVRYIAEAIKIGVRSLHQERALAPSADSVAEVS